MELTALPAPATGLAMAGLWDGPLYIVDDGAHLAEPLADRLGHHGVDARWVATGAGLPSDAQNVVLLTGLAPVEDTHGTQGIQRALDLQYEAFRVARRLARRLTDNDDVNGDGENDCGVFVTVQDTGGDFGLSGRQGERAWLGGLAALARTVAKEWPSASVKAIDCERTGRGPREQATAIAEELLSGGPLLDVGLRADRTRVTPHPCAVPPFRDSADTRIGPDSVVVVTGGARGVTAAGLLALARARRPRLALLGRTRLTEEPPGLPTGSAEEVTRALASLRGRGAGSSPSELAADVRQIMAVREVRAALAAIEEAGSQVRYETVDVGDMAALPRCLERIRDDWGPVTAIVHAAGVLADRLVADKTDEQFTQVMRTKATGLRALLDATAEDPLKLISVFSSVAATFGNAGQCDYAMANETLTQVMAAESARRPDCRVKSLIWGPWRGGMVTPELAAHFDRHGTPLLPLDTGAEAFVSELESRAPHAIITGSLGAAAAPRPLAAVSEPAAAQVTVTARSHPQLADHVIAGDPVLPLAQTLEWFTAAARSWRPTSPRVLLRDVRVLRRAVPDQLDTDGARFTLRADRSDTHALSVELHGAGSTPHCRARIAAAPHETTGIVPPGELEPSRRNPLYDGHTLFHGPLFQSLATIEGISLTGARATLTGLREMGWSGETWQTDPAAVDGALQLAVAWAEDLFGDATLPMAIGEFHAPRLGPARGPVTCVLRAVPPQTSHAQCHLTLTDDEGLLADIRDLELVLRPS
ncbi:SDR family NAD(P)-dependent oxidoreductase [Streptomyces sp. NPDC058471]|uniref:SDR family NAD(P)-dependent oxidoreductase n=1 Tax=Streptomyces sp. NPDC058471 TaxID=3346516 RepID=UPI0036643FE2